MSVLTSKKSAVNHTLWSICWSGGCRSAEFNAKLTLWLSSKHIKISSQIDFPPPRSASDTIHLSPSLSFIANISITNEEICTSHQDSSAVQVSFVSNEIFGKGLKTTSPKQTSKRWSHTHKIVTSD